MNLHGIDRPSYRLALFGVALAGLFMALAVQQAYGDRGLVLALAYWAGRLLFFRGLLLQPSPYTISMYVTGPLLVAGAMLPETALDGWGRTLVWLAAAVLDLSAPTLLRRRLSGMRVDAGHLAGRYGLLVLIAIGETVVAVGAPSRPLRTSTPRPGRGRGGVRCVLRTRRGTCPGRSSGSCTAAARSTWPRSPTPAGRCSARSRRTASPVRPWSSRCCRSRTSSRDWPPSACSRPPWPA
ncbi:MAG TPA: low temperature requirement protein A [Kribbellaceae bacterium]|nr:low temperature requirement protein A [Kribbellaceae bacterium]